LSHNQLKLHSISLQYMRMIHPRKASATLVNGLAPPSKVVDLKVFNLMYEYLWVSDRAQFATRKYPTPYKARNQ